MYMKQWKHQPMQLEMQQYAESWKGQAPRMLSLIHIRNHINVM